MRTLLVILVVLVLVMPVVAQEEAPELLCTSPAALEAALTAYDAGADAIEAARTGTDVHALYEALAQLQSVVDATGAACNPLQWEGTNAKLIGPVTIPEGVYRATVTTNGFFSSSIEALEGNCDADSFLGMFNLMQGQADSGAEVLVRSSGCEALIKTENVTAAWTLVFEKLG